MSDPIPTAARARIDADLAKIARDENVRILFAVESGSRAWGFPSPDSDYDARFVYVRPLDWYLQLFDGRDVIELPIDGDFDVNGWDLRKALRLLLKPNPVLLEWLASPIRYAWTDAVCARLADLGRRTTFGPACRHHYFGVAQRLGREHLEGRERVNLKKYFYVLRPALCLMWLRLGLDGPPPMDLPVLMAPLPVSAAFRDVLGDLLARKAESSEVGEGPRIAALDAVIDAELAAARELGGGAPNTDHALAAEADALFRAIVKGEI
jgi:uncharacterized protein